MLVNSNYYIYYSNLNLYKKIILIKVVLLIRHDENHSRIDK